MHTIRKTVKVGTGFKTSDAMHNFLNAQSDNTWVVTSEPDYYGAFNPDLAVLKPGTYAYAGGKWHNVKTLDACMLAHI